MKTAILLSTFSLAALSQNRAMGFSTCAGKQPLTTGTPPVAVPAEALAALSQNHREMGFSTGAGKQPLTTGIPPAPAEASRREVLSKAVAFVGAAAIAGISGGTQEAEALDMDAFVNKELEADVANCDPKRDPKCKPKLSPDEALCQYGQGAKKSEACKRAKAAGGDTTQRGGGKSLGGAYAM